MSLDFSNDVLFVGQGTSTICFYRVMLPALALGADWCGVIGQPGRLSFPTGLIRKESADARHPVLDDYKVVIIQQPYGPGWQREVRRLRAAGVKVLYEVDDYIHGIRRMKDHGFRAHFDKALLERAERTMRLCDGLVCSTEYLARRYRKFNSNVAVCPNGIDLSRYDLTIPDRTTINIGWSGATGHRRAIAPWLAQTMAVMKMHPASTFVSIGQPFAEVVAEHLGPERATSVPFCQIEQYPGAMTMFDVALAPAGQGSFFRGKSDLRWLEASALGIPAIVDPIVYSEVVNEKTGMVAETPQQMAVALDRLLRNKTMRDEIGAAAHAYVRENRAFPQAAQAWVAAIDRLT